MATSAELDKSTTDVASNNYSVMHVSNFSRSMTSPLDRNGGLYWLTVTSFIIALFLVFVGIVGNSFIIATVRSKRCQYNSHGIQLTALAFSDMKSLLVGLFNRRFVWNALGKDMRSLTTTGCRTYVFANRVAKLSSTMFVILVCIDRFVAIWFPLKAKVFTTRRTSAIIVSSIFGSIYAYAFLTVFFGNVRYGKCIPDVVLGSVYWSNVLKGVSLFLSTIIPTVVLVSLTPLTTVKLYYQRRLRRRLAPTEEKDETIRVTSVLVSISVVYICLVTSFAGTLWILMLNGANPLASAAPWAAIFMETLVTCDSLNCALNVFLYGFFSSRFRRDFYSLFRRGHSSNAVGPSS